MSKDPLPTFVDWMEDIHRRLGFGGSPPESYDPWWPGVRTLADDILSRLDRIEERLDALERHRSSSQTTRTN